MCGEVQTPNPVRPDAMKDRWCDIVDSDSDDVDGGHQIMPVEEDREKDADVMPEADVQIDDGSHNEDEKYAGNDED